MRLSFRQISEIKKAVQKIDSGAEVKLFGSRVDDAKVAGDIDLLINSQTMGWREVAKLRGILEMNLGEQKMDIVLKSRAEPSFIQLIESDAVLL
ncbi:MAG: nucleotidyltransferase domain-containing protein [Gammaproteobacteria bacterium]|jgi:predicted nucleotidyltransferase|nr:nucleotidyltransferase domain-containing protein [Gammaproteobacteria bacterium]